MSWQIGVPRLSLAQGTALLDRLLHPAHFVQISGQSYRATDERNADAIKAASKNA